jgi:hypothetical protein
MNINSNILLDTLLPPNLEFVYWLADLTVFITDVWGQEGGGIGGRPALLVTPSQGNFPA